MEEKELYEQVCILNDTSKYNDQDVLALAQFFATKAKDPYTVIYTNEGVVDRVALCAYAEQHYLLYPREIGVDYMSSLPLPMKKIIVAFMIQLAARPQLPRFEKDVQSKRHVIVLDQDIDRKNLEAIKQISSMSQAAKEAESEIYPPLPLYTDQALAVLVVASLYDFHVAGFSLLTSFAEKLDVGESTYFTAIQVRRYYVPPIGHIYDPSKNLMKEYQDIYAKVTPTPALLTYLKDKCKDERLKALFGLSNNNRLRVDSWKRDEFIKERGLKPEEDKLRRAKLSTSPNQIIWSDPIALGQVGHMTFDDIHGEIHNPQPNIASILWQNRSRQYNGKTRIELATSVQHCTITEAVARLNEEIVDLNHMPDPDKTVFMTTKELLPLVKEILVECTHSRPWNAAFVLHPIFGGLTTSMDSIDIDEPQEKVTDIIESLEDDSFKTTLLVHTEQQRSLAKVLGQEDYFRNNVVNLRLTTQVVVPSVNAHDLVRVFNSPSTLLFRSSLINPLYEEIMPEDEYGNKYGSRIRPWFELEPKETKKVVEQGKLIRKKANVIVSMNICDSPPIITYVHLKSLLKTGAWNEKSEDNPQRRLMVHDLVARCNSVIHSPSTYELRRTGDTL